MEFGHLDFESAVKRQINTSSPEFDITFTRHYWKEMLACLAAVHALDIVHADLKPANFILVGGRLKLIDFGISNPIGYDTLNVHRDYQVGTPNYIAPEALLDNTRTADKKKKTDKDWKTKRRLESRLHPIPNGLRPRSLRKYPQPDPQDARHRRSHGFHRVSRPWNRWHVASRCACADTEGVSLLVDTHRRSREVSETSVNREQLGAMIRGALRYCRAAGVPAADGDDVAELAGVFFERLTLANSGHGQRKGE